MTTLEALQVIHDQRQDLTPAEISGYIATFAAIFLAALEHYPITDFYPVITDEANN